MPPEDDKAIEDHAAEEKQARADFESGMPEEVAPAKRGAKPEAAEKPEPKPAAKAADPAPVAKPPEPKYVRVTEEQFAALNAAAAKTASFETQLSKAFGTIGNMQKVLTTLQAATPRGFKVEIPKDAFAAMERDFPELAQHSRAALEATLRGLTGTGPANAEIDPEQLTRLVGEHAAKLRAERTEEEVEALVDIYPDWRKIVGAVNTLAGEVPDPNNPYRKWLATQPADYQARLNSTNSAAVISRSISRFQTETKTVVAKPPAANLQAQLRAARIRDAVQPRGDGGQAPPARTDDDEFMAGFASR